MKANAPPPEPPTTPPETADAAPPVPAVPTGPKPAAWPEWFAAVDVVLALVGVVLAFLLASFAARHSDLWLHLAGGRLIAEGKLHLGSDPLSFADPERPWVRTSWLFDLAAYLAYRADPTGVVLVGVKAAAFAAAFGLFALLRRPGHALWPWAVLGVVAALAAAPYAALRPAVASMLMLSLTLALIARLRWRADSWREPLILAGVFALWANLDAWFFLGPLALACVLVGELVQRQLFGPPGAGRADPADPFAPGPPAKALAKALGLGVVACFLNPYLLAGLAKDPGEALTQLLPMELGFGLPAGASKSHDLSGLTLTPLSDDYATSAGLGNSVNGYSYAALVVAGAGALPLGFRRLRATHVLLWAAFAGLSLLHVRLIPYFAVIVAPLIAGHLNGLSGRLRLGSAADPKTRILLTACGLGRVVCVALAAALPLMTYPGWLHPQVAARSARNRLDWSLAPEPGLERSAKLVAALRADGSIPDGLRGLNTSAEFGNYLAWHAPAVRVFVNGRYPLHRHELPDLVAARQGVGGGVGGGDPATAAARSSELNRVVAARDAGYLAVAGPTEARLDTQSGQRLDARAALGLASDDARWVLWHLDGRLALLGRVTGDPAADGRARASRFDAARPAFGPDLPRLPEGRATPAAFAPEEPAEQFLDRPPAVPPELDDAAAYRVYADYARFRAEVEYGQGVDAERSAAMALLGGGRAGPPRPRPPEDDAFTAPVLVIRAARQAIAANPSLAEPHALLAEAYALPGAPVLDVPLFSGLSERQLQTLTAQFRALERVPVAGFPRGGGVGPDVVLEQSFALAGNFEQTGQFDAAQLAYDRHVAYFEALPESVRKDLASRAKPGGKPEDALKARRAGMQTRQDAYGREVLRRGDALKRVADPLSRFGTAAQTGLPLHAADLFRTLSPDPAKPIPPQVVITQVALELRAGRLEAAAADLAELDERVQEILRTGANDEVAYGFRVLQMAAARLEGNPGSPAAVQPPPPGPPARPAARGAWDPTAARVPEVITGLQALAGGTVAPVVSDQAGPSRSPLAGYLNRILQAREALQQESYASSDRAMLMLLDGNVADARSWLLESLKPQGVSLADLGDPERAARAERYLRLIDRAATPRAK